MSTKNQTKSKTESKVVKSTKKKIESKNTVKKTGNSKKTTNIKKNPTIKNSVNKKVNNKKVSKKIEENKIIKNDNVETKVEIKDMKTIVIPTLLMVITFFILIVGATYAYFNVSTTVSGGSTKVYTDVETVGVSTLRTGNNLSLNLTLVDMMQSSNDKVYYASLNGIPSTTEISEVIGTAEVDGNGVMKCTYELVVNSSGTKNMYTAFQNMSTKSEGQLVLNIAGIDYDLYNVTFPLSIKGTLENVKEGASKDIKASFKIVNKSDVDQSKLAGTDIILSFSVKEYECEIVG